jgi:hypothetical protein
MTSEEPARLNRERALRAIAGAVGLLVALIPIAFIFVAALAAGSATIPTPKVPGWLDS